MRHAVITTLVLCFACGGSESLTDQAKRKAGEAADDAADHVRQQAADAADGAKEGALEAVDAAKRGTAAAAADAWAAVTTPGNLSAAAKALLAAAQEDGSIEAVLAAGTQLAPVAADMALALADVIDRDTKIEPILQKVDDEAGRAATDEAIGDMPRVEVIDGVTVGFRDLSTMDASKHVSESGYLAVWRKGGYRVGFVYRSRREIDLNKLVGLAPRIISAVGAVVPD